MLRGWGNSLRRVRILASKSWLRLKISPMNLWNIIDWVISKYFLNYTVKIMCVLSVCVFESATVCFFLWVIFIFLFFCSKNRFNIFIVGVNWFSNKDKTILELYPTKVAYRLYSNIGDFKLVSFLYKAQIWHNSGVVNYSLLKNTPFTVCTYWLFYFTS